MDRIVTLLLDPIFWFATILIGFLLSVVANFATDGIKQFWGRFSTRQRERNERARERIIAEARECLRSESYLLLCSAKLSDFIGYMLLNFVGATLTIILFGTFLLYGMLQGLPNRIANTPATNVLDRDIVTAALTNNMFRELLESSPVTLRFWMILFIFAVIVASFAFLWRARTAGVNATYYSKILSYAKGQLSEQLESLPPNTGK